MILYKLPIKDTTKNIVEQKNETLESIVNAFKQEK